MSGELSILFGEIILEGNQYFVLNIVKVRFPAVVVDANSGEGACISVPPLPQGICPETFAGDTKSCSQ